MKLSLTHSVAAIAVATAMSIIPSVASAEQKEGDDWPVIFNWDLTSLKEDFATAENNQPLKLERWKNIANEGTRAWWGYDLDENGTVNKVAKVTGYDADATSATPCEMLLITPPLDAHNALTNFLSFRVMGENLTDDMDGKFEIVYISDSIFGVSIEPLVDIVLPSKAADNGQWRDYIVDLNSMLELDADFCIGFRYTAVRSKDSKAVYYLDDVTYGQDNIPYIKTSIAYDDFISYIGIPYSRTFTAKGYALQSEITIELSGPDADKFTITPNKVSAEGGRITIGFASDEVRIHEAQILLKSEGAFSTTVYLSGDNRMSPSAIEDVEAPDAITVAAEGPILQVSAPLAIRALTVHNAAGQLLASSTPNASAAAIDLPQAIGVMIVTVVTDSATKSVKVVR